MHIYHHKCREKSFTNFIKSEIKFITSDNVHVVPNAIKGMEDEEIPKTKI